MSDADTLLSAFLRVMSLCMLFLIVDWLCVVFMYLVYDFK